MTMATLALSELLGSTVYDTTGTACGRVREVGSGSAGGPFPGRDASIVKTHPGNRMLPFSAVSRRSMAAFGPRPPRRVGPADGAEGLFLLSRDLLDQQVIDVHGRKVVRVNDVDFHQETARSRPF